MTALEYLLEVRAMDYRLQNLEDEIKELISISQRAGAMDYSKEFLDGGEAVKEPAFLKALDKVEDKNEHYQELIDEYKGYRKEAYDKVQKLSDPIDARVLYLKFFQYKTFETIAKELNYSFGAVRHHYYDGLKEFDNRKLWEN